MTAVTTDTLVVGAGRAGLAVVETLANADHPGRILLVGDEAGMPYERPQVSKRMLLEDPARDPCELPGARLLQGAGAIDYMAGRSIAGIDLAAREAVFDGGTRVAWRRLVLATGTRPRSLAEVPTDAPNVHVLRTRADAERLAGAAARSGAVVIIGAGFIGMEAASSLAANGASVTVLDPAPQPLVGPLGPLLGATVAARARRAGVRLVLGAQVGRSSRAPDGSVVSVTLTDGSVLATPTLLVAVGSIPRSPLGDHPRGIAVDEFGRAAMPDVYACGDLAAWHWLATGRSVRIEHWLTAAGQGRAVGRAILGELDPFDEAPFFWSDQFGVRIQRVGHGDPTATWRGCAADPARAAELVAPCGAVRAIAAIDRPDLVAAWRREVRAAA